jgi:hypothetical protein
MPQRSQGPRGADPGADRPEWFRPHPGQPGPHAGRFGPAVERPGSPAEGPGSPAEPPSSLAERPHRLTVPRDARPPTSVATPVSRRQGGTHRAAGKRDVRQAVPARTDLLWLLGVAAAFTVAVLALNPLHQGFSWDETVYVSQISKHTPAMPWAAERARGMPLLVAPATLFTGSPAALRVYLSVLGGAGLFLALIAWRGLRPARVLALAGLVFGGLWAAQAEAPLVFPNVWAAVGALAGAGLFLRGVTRIGSPRVNAILLGGTVAFTALMRPADAVFLFVPLLFLGLAVTAWRSWPLLLAVTAGLAVGLGEWLAEAYLYFGGLGARLRGTNAASGGTGLHLLNGLQVMNGRTSWTYPGILGWWAVFILLGVFGVWAVSRTRGWPYALVHAACATSVYVLYSFPDMVSARYLLPTYLLLAIPVADGIAWLSASASRSRRIAGITVASVFIVAELASQHLVLAKVIRSRDAGLSSNSQVISELHHLGIHSPCIITGDSNQPFTPYAMPAAFQIGCAYAWDISKLTFPTRRRVVMIEGGGAHPFGYASGWPKVSLPTIDGVVQIWLEPKNLTRTGAWHNGQAFQASLTSAGRRSGPVCGLRPGATAGKDAELVPLWIGKTDAHKSAFA